MKDIKTKIVQIEIRDNSNLTDEEKNDRVKILVFDFIRAHSEYSLENLNHILKILVELADLKNLIELEGQENGENSISQK